MIRHLRVKEVLGKERAQLPNVAKCLFALAALRRRVRQPRQDIAVVRVPRQRRRQAGWWHWAQTPLPGARSIARAAGTQPHVLAGILEGDLHPIEIRRVLAEGVERRAMATGAAYLVRS